MAAALAGMTEAVHANSVIATSQFGMIDNMIICVAAGGVLQNGGFRMVTGTIFGTLTFGIVFQNISFTTIDMDLNQLFIGAPQRIAILMIDNLGSLSTSASITRTN